MQFTGFETHFFNRLKTKNLIEIKAGNTFRKDVIVSNFYLKKDALSISQPVEYQNNIEYSAYDLFIKMNYLFEIKKFKLSTNLNAHQIINKITDFGQEITEKPFYINLLVSIEWKLNSKNKFLTTYNFSTTNASAIEILPNYVNTAFRSFEKGTGTFNQTEASNIFFNYTLGNWGDRFFMNTSVFYIKNHDFFSSNTIIAPDYYLTEKILIKNQETFIFSTNIDRFINPISSNLKAKINASKSNFKNIIDNTELRTVKSTNFVYGAELRSGFKGFLNYHLGYEISENSIETTQKNSYQNSTGFLDIIGKFSKKKLYPNTN